MKKNRIKRKGYIAIEAVIVSGLVLSMGFLAMLNFTDYGVKAASMLGSLNPFGEVNPGQIGASDSYDSNGYATSLGIDVSDINPVTDFEFQDLGTSYRLVKYLGTDSSVVIPKYYSDGNPIVEIGDRAFANHWAEDGMTPLNNELVSVAIPNSITMIGELAFSSNILANVTVPGSVEAIGDQAFRNNQLEQVILLDGIKTIGVNAFSYNRISGELSIPNSVTDVAEYAFASNQITSIIFSDSMTEVKPRSFTDNMLTSLSLPSSITKIGDGAFADAISFADLRIPESIVEIDAFAFSGNYALEVINFMSSVLVIREGAFYNNNNLSFVAFSGTQPYDMSYMTQLFGNSSLSNSSILVPVGLLAEYQAMAPYYGVEVGAFYEEGK